MSTFLTSVFAHDARSGCHMVLLFNLHRNDKTSVSQFDIKPFVRTEAFFCRPDEFVCNNTLCKLHVWVCDGEDDCGDNSDEDPEMCGNPYLSFLELKIIFFNFLMLYVVSVWVTALQKIADAQMQHKTCCNILFSFL